MPVRPGRPGATLVVAVVMALATLAGCSGEAGAPSDPRAGDRPGRDGASGPEGPLAVGSGLSHGACEGEGPGELGSPPMDLDDVAMVIPYGLMVGNHVTPIDHQYFSPVEFDSPRDAYEVRAMGDATLVEIGRRTGERGDEYRLVFSVTCTFFYYYDLLTSLAPRVREAFDSSPGTAFQRRMALAVAEGEMVGRIGGQTLDFAVWDTTKPLAGFVRPESYAGERWKPYTADPLDYYAPDLRTAVLGKYLRAVEPVSGRIDYDVDGRLVGNWFEEGTGGYAGDRTSPDGYWSTHLAFAPNHLDPSWFVVSMGRFDGAPRQFVAATNAPQPQDVTEASGVVAYDLVDWEYARPDGNRWDRRSLARELEVVPADHVKGCALVELTAPRRLRFEAVPGRSCSGVDGFTSAARLYER